MIPKIVHESWHEPLRHLWDDPRLALIQKQLAYFKFCPEAKNIFRAFSLPITSVRIVMIALAPYQKVSGDNQLYATGLAMGVPDGYDTETLKSVRDALWNDYRDLRSEDLNPTLEHWHNQGVMLLNKGLTVTQNSSNPREHIYSREYDRFQWPGWEWFTSGVVEAIDRYCNSIVFAFLGKEAGEYAELVSGKNYIEHAPHPVARYYYMRANPGKEVPKHIDFATCELFKRIDDITYNIDKTKINWYEVKGS